MSRMKTASRRPQQRQRKAKIGGVAQLQLLGVGLAAAAAAAAGGAMVLVVVVVGRRTLEGNDVCHRVHDGCIGANLSPLHVRGVLLLAPACEQVRV
jgi:hypothetical protein